MDAKWSPVDLSRGPQMMRPVQSAFLSTATPTVPVRLLPNLTLVKRSRSRALDALHLITLRTRCIWPWNMSAAPGANEGDPAAKSNAANRFNSKRTEPSLLNLFSWGELDDSRAGTENDDEDDGDDDISSDSDVDPVLDRGRVFGAWLDNQVLRLDRIQSAAMQAPGQTLQERAERAFARGVQALTDGHYATASDAIFQASALAGQQTRLGGEYLLWLAQALDAQGKNARAQEVLRRLQYHKDRDVRQVAESLLFILQAPRLRLGPESFVKIDLDALLNQNRARDIPGWKKRQRRYRFGSGSSAALAGTGKRRREPTKYSLEWFTSQESVSAEELERANQASRAAMLASSGVMLLILFMLRFLGR
jgi:hypothetical protein